MAAWTSQESYAAKVVRMRDTGVPAAVGGGVLKLTAKVTILNDFNVDTMSGEDGLDWYFASTFPATNEIGLAVGGLRDRAIGEVLSELP